MKKQNQHKMRTIIIDDEPLALDVLESHIQKIPELELVAKCSNALEAGELLRKEKIDLMFLDIQMPQLTGTEFLKSLQHPPMVIFTTAYPNYAVEGFELNAMDYLLKPISFERFVKAVNKALEHQALESKQGEEKEEEDNDDFVFVKADKKLIKVYYKDILYIEGLKDYVIIYTSSDKIITLQTMKNLETKLPLNTFKRIHRSYIVNLDKIQAVIGNMVEILQKEQSKLLPIGKNYREEILKIINEKRL